jgi:uncharacterized membrane protein YfcA
VAVPILAFVLGLGIILLGKLALVAFFGAALAAVTGYGAGLILPLILVPFIGAEATVPVVGISSLLMNAGRIVAFWRDFDYRLAAVLVATGIPTTILGSYAFTLLTGAGASIVIGTALLLMVPGRRLMAKFRGHLSLSSIAMAGAGFGFVNGGAAGVGVLLISILLAAGMQGTAVIATDAGVSFVLAVVKTIVFQASGMLTPAVWIMALIIGAVAFPAAFVARWLIPKLPSGVHIWILDGVVLVGGALLIARGLA